MSHSGTNLAPDFTPSKSSSPEELETVIKARQERLAANVDEFLGRVHPKAVIARSSQTFQEKAKDTFFTDNGDLRGERVAAAGAVAAAAVAALIALVINRGTNKKRKVTKLRQKLAKLDR
ncbi:DUF3618 domain-containing protein [Saxibacter everestensis]|uniref:DUF3618 domain-containing protein n=1 Tax=Saxibacter everestensis TaxID=2909229 RepID=A0ABY8QXI9_9MICO|nr:DUF3618 domain-containing protein [Brevibacteriaceae bacterium ZFBP1038]